MDAATVVTLLVVFTALAGSVSHGLHIQDALDHIDKAASSSEDNMDEHLPELEGVKADNSMNNRLLTALLKALLRGSERQARNSVLHQPHRFGLSSRGPRFLEDQMNSPDWEAAPSQIWSMAVPQRFGKK
ncbi:pro-FMRFamide-related neuropeptide FF like [Dunckerocampus dactyliophorus]|uniref:pro-FMRFamide-related neuropeptide FF like n=1 Tax=Dunckerocampus dactyliophorus TaxID=161453 RepID=UPI0024074931|nr:pro-FMRFamide-related neuropeptide FF like [Dunckerocampus dactyliophorus]